MNLQPRGNIIPAEALTITSFHGRLFLKSVQAEEATHRHQKRHIFPTVQAGITKIREVQAERAGHCYYTNNHPTAQLEEALEQHHQSQQKVQLEEALEQHRQKCQRVHQEEAAEHHPKYRRVHQEEAEHQRIRLRVQQDEGEHPKRRWRVLQIQTFQEI